MSIRNSLKPAALTLLLSVAGTGSALADGHAGKAHSHGMPHDMSMFDSDGDGQISPQERQAMRAKHAREADTNLDGLISVDEMVAMHEKHQRAHMHQRLMRADTNKDGVVSVEEFANMPPPKMARRDMMGRDQRPTPQSQDSPSAKRFY